MSSDLMLFLRSGYSPGSAQRPLVVDQPGFWSIDNDYPGPTWTPGPTPVTP